MKTIFIFLVFALTFFEMYGQKPPCRQERIEVNYYTNLVNKIPYLKTDMSEEVILAYLRYDSLRNSISSDSFFNFFKKNLYSKEVDLILKDFFIMLDYDYEVFLKNDLYVNDTIPMKNNTFNSVLKYFILERFKNTPILGALLYSTHLLKLNLSNYDYRFNNITSEDIHIYKAKILSTLKGNITASCKSIEIPIDSKEYIYQNPSSKLNTLDSCIQIYHFKTDNVFNINKEYYTFVNYQVFCALPDSNLAFYSPGITVIRDDAFPLHKSLLLVENDSVYDPHNFYIPEGVISEVEWLKRINENIAKIKNMDYLSSQDEIIYINSVNKIYPNPAKSNISIDFIVEPENLPYIKVELYNLTGILQSKLDYSVDYNNSNGQGTINCNIENIPNGYYIIVIDNGKRKVAKPFIVNRD